MNNRNLYNRVFAIFGTFMVFFYFGLGAFIIFHPLLDNYIDKGLRVIFGIPILLYGIYRTLTSYEKIREAFFSNDNDEE